MTKKALLIFAKNPLAGKVKTRLAATIGDDAALAVYRQLQLHTVSVTEHLPVDKFVFYSDYMEQGDVWDGKVYYKEVQQGNDLGGRMKNAFASIFQRGYERAAIIGTDCPGLSTTIISDAFANLQWKDIVVGPAEDGGYYLLGMNQSRAALFDGIGWSTNTVLNDTIKKLRNLQLSYFLLPVLNDVDEEKDLNAFEMLRK